MPTWVSDAANVATIIEAFIALVALILAVIGLRAARQVWPSIRRKYSKSTHVEHQSGTVVTGDHAQVTVMQTERGAAKTSDDEGSIE
jgi:hypothetical protein